MEVMEIHEEQMKKIDNNFATLRLCVKKNRTMETWRSWKTNQEFRPAPLTQLKKQPVQK